MMPKFRVTGVVFLQEPFSCDVEAPTFSAAMRAAEFRMKQRWTGQNPKLWDVGIGQVRFVEEADPPEPETTSTRWVLSAHPCAGLQIYWNSDTATWTQDPGAATRHRSCDIEWRGIEETANLALGATWVQVPQTEKRGRD